MRFAEIRHQERALAIIRQALASGRVPHAYLFEGPAGVGKELTARALAARLLCERAEPAGAADACGQCQSCRLIAADNHPDFHLIHRGLHKFHPDRAVRAGKGLFLAVDVVRQFLIEPANITPSLGRCRVFVIRDAERMNEQAQNALLKTLEEPPGNACLILLTSSADRLLPTIRSRCQRVSFDLLPSEFVRQQLQARAGLEAEEARTLAALCAGRLGVGLEWHRRGLLAALARVRDELAAGRFREPEAFAKTLLETAEQLAAASGEDDETAEQAGDEPGEPTRGGSRTIGPDQMRDALKLVLLLVATVYRDALLVRSGTPPSLRVLPPTLELPAELAAADADRLSECIQSVATCEWLLDRNVAPQLACEHLAIALSGLAPATL